MYTYRWPPIPTSAQELAEFYPEFSIFTAGYVHRDAAHQLAVFNDPLMDSFKKTIEEGLGIKLLSVMYLGRRQLNLRSDKKTMPPEDLAGVNLRIPGTDAWQFLGKALGASPTSMAFTEIYTGLQTGTIDGQDNPLPNVDAFRKRVQGMYLKSDPESRRIAYLLCYRFISEPQHTDLSRKSKTIFVKLPVKASSKAFL